VIAPQDNDSKRHWNTCLNWY